jgi:dTDP-4-dehydrorhamnose 3,5-epimerase
MHFEETQIKNAWLIDPDPKKDDRGRFMRAWCSFEFHDHGLSFQPVQANMGFSLVRGTIRGMHYQVSPALEAKLVRCTRGAAFDVVIDLRAESPTYGQWISAQLTAENGRMLYVPEGCAHGFQSVEDNTEIYYMTSALYHPQAVRGVRFDDPAFDIQWPLPATLVSQQDRNWPLVPSKGMLQSPDERGEK